MIYKIKITEKAGEVSRVVEVETDDLVFAKHCLVEENEYTPEVNIKEDYSKNLQELFKQMEKEAIKPSYPAAPGGIEYWMRQPTALGSGDIMVAVTNA